MYYPGLAPRGGGTEDLRQYIETELSQLSAILQAMRTQYMQLAPLNREPQRPRDGMVVFADGVAWNPGGGEGIYVFRDGSWMKQFDFGSNTVWVDIDFPIIIRSTGPNVPTLVSVQGNISAPQWAVNDFNVCEGQELIHSWKEGTAGSWHIHLITNGLDATDRYVRFQVEWFWFIPFQPISSTVTTTGEYMIPANTPDKTMVIFNVGSAPLPNGKIGGHVFARLSRITAVGGSAPTNNPWVTMLQMHVECDSLGSRELTTK